MDYVGMIYHGVENLLGNITATKQGDFIVVRVLIDDKEVIKFPLAGDSDSNAIRAAITNVVNQTKLASILTRVELEPVA